MYIFTDETFKVDILYYIKTRRGIYAESADLTKESGSVSCTKDRKEDSYEYYL